MPVCLRGLQARPHPPVQHAPSMVRICLITCTAGWCALCAPLTVIRPADCRLQCTVRHAHQHAHCQVSACLIKCTGWLVCLVRLVDSPSGLPQQTWHTPCHALHHALCQARISTLHAQSCACIIHKSAAEPAREAMNFCPGNSSFPWFATVHKKLSARS